MSSSGLTRINISAISSFDGVLRELKILEKQLAKSELSRFSVFNTAYSIVTNAIRDAANDNYFEKSDFIEKFTVCFASYYFQAINEIASESPKLPRAWAKMRDAAKAHSVPVSIILLMGANAHINHDLPVAMASFMKQNKNYALRDARRVDTLLMKSGKQIIPAFDEPTKALNNLKRRLRFVYYRPVMYTILFWRIIAWRNYGSILRNSPRDNHKERSEKIANRLLKLGKLFN